MKLPRLRQVGHAFYFDTCRKPRKWIPLGSDRAEALKKYAALMAQKADVGTVGEILVEYMQSLAGKVKESTLGTYRQYERRLQRVFGQTDINAVTPKHIFAYLDAAAKKRTTGKYEISLLRAAYAHAMRTRDILINPALGVKEERRPVKEKRYITHGELELVLSKAPPLLAVGIEIAYATSLRVGDVLKLRWDDFTNEASIVQQKTAGRAPRQRYVLTPELRELLDRARALQTVGSMFIIATRGGQPVKYATFWTWWRTALKAAEIPTARFHDIRRKAATDRDAEGGDAQKLLGHSTPQATKGYIAGTKINTVEPLKRRKG